MGSQNAGAATVLRRAGGNRSEIHGDIVIGSAFPITGFAAADGQEMVNGYTLAIEEVNKAGGILGAKIRHVVVDIGPTFAPDVVISAFRRLIYQENVHAICLGYILNTGFEYKVVQQAGMPYLHVSTTEADVTKVRNDRKDYWMTFMCDPTEIYYGLGLFGFIQGLIAHGQFKPKNKKVAIITGDSAYSTTIATLAAQKVKAAGWTVNLFEKVVQPITEWGPTLAKIRADPPAVIVNTDFSDSDLAAFTKQFRQNPTPSLVYEQYGPSVPAYLKLAGAAANGIIWSTVTGTYYDAIGNAFRAKYQKRFGYQPGFSNAGSGYDLVHVYANAVKQAGDPNDKRKVCEMVARSNVRGVNGNYKFNYADLSVKPYPDVVKRLEDGQAHLYFQIQNQQHKLIAPAPITNGSFQLPDWLH
jgi:branched-chain amino acid transport system substrate-binding protein